VDVHDGWQAGSLGSAYAWMTVVMCLLTAMAGRWVLRAVPLTPRGIAMAILADRELTGVHRNVD
jgi:hypothetical protein